MPVFDDIKPGARLRGLDPAGIVEIVQVARFGDDALSAEIGCRRAQCESWALH